MSGLSETYECYVCHGVFTKPRTNEEAIAEARATWGKMSKPVEVCEPCGVEVFAWAQLDHPELLR